MSCFPVDHAVVCGPSPRFIGGILAACLWTVVAAGAAAQDADARFSSWKLVESATETRAYKDALRSGGGFDAAARGFLEQIALPQLELEANRPTIERIRKRLRELLLVDITNEKIADEASKTFMDFMQSLAGKEEAAPVVRVNAMLLIGELQSVDRKPWPPAAATLAGAAANADLPKAVRIAATAGLAKHVDSAKGAAESQARLSAVANPAIHSVLVETFPPEATVEHDWLASRCLSMLALLGPAQADTIDDVARILGDKTRSIDVRVRAAATLAVISGPQSRVDSAAAIKSIESVAVHSLERDAGAAERQQLDRQYGGGTAGQPFPGPSGALGSPPGFPPQGGMGQFQGQFPGQPTVEQMIPREVCRRAAWRLSVLADSILTVDGKSGLALLAGADAAPARELSQKLRRAAMELDATPEDAVLLQALSDLQPPEPAPAAGDKNPPAAEDQSPPAAPKTGKAEKAASLFPSLSAALWATA